MRIITAPCSVASSPMITRTLLLAARSHGDVEPILALADVLSKSTAVENTTLVIPGKYARLVPQLPKVTVIKLKLDLDDGLKFLLTFSNSKSERDIDEQDPIIVFKRLGAMIRATVLPDTWRIVYLAQKSKATVVIKTLFTAEISNIIYEKIGIPNVTLHLQLMMSSTYCLNDMTHPKKAS